MICAGSEQLTASRREASCVLGDRTGKSRRQYFDVVRRTLMTEFEVSTVVKFEILCREGNLLCVVMLESDQLSPVLKYFAARRIWSVGIRSVVRAHRILTTLDARTPTGWSETTKGKLSAHSKMENDANRLIASLYRLLGVLLSLCANISHTGDDDMLSKHNVSGLIPLFGSGSSDTDSYLQELSGFWSYNDTTDLSKYEDFDHSRFLDRPSDRLEEVAAMTPHTPLRAANVRRTTSTTTEAGPTTRSPNMPEFDRKVTTNVTAQLGGTAFLNCRVFKLGERTVSWVRRRDWHILTSGVLTYTNDERFQAVHADNTDDWNLQIKYVQKRDNGTYECQ
ncbi:hypothetical protein LSTR_LSTR007247, partial [Laodelphax striatellus]